MVGVVLVGVVRVYAMGVVGLDQQRALDRPAEGVAFRQQAAQYLFEERTVGAAMRTGTDFLVVGADQEQIQVELENQGNCSILELNITLPDR